MSRPNLLLTSPQAAGHDDLAILPQGLSNCVEGFLNRGVDKPAGIHHDQVRIAIGRHEIVAFRPELRHDLFAVDERLGTPQTDETDTG